MKIPNYTLSNAKRDFDTLSIANIDKVSVIGEERELRDKIIEGWDQIFENYELDNGIKSKDKYKFDLAMGVLLYGILKLEYNFDNRTLSDDGFWRYLSIKIVPDLVFVRWELNPERYYSNKRRIYLKTIFWYIDISWQGNIKETLRVLNHKNMTTDTILNMIERPGLGFNKELYREILRKYSTIDDLDDESRYILRRVMVLNTARIKSINPILSKGGVEAYVNQLFKDVM